MSPTPSACNGDGAHRPGAVRRGGAGLSACLAPSCLSGELKTLRTEIEINYNLQQHDDRLIDASI